MFRSSVLFACRTSQLNRAFFRMRSLKKTDMYQAGVPRKETLPVQRSHAPSKIPKFYRPSLATVTTPRKKNIHEWDDKQCIIICNFLGQKGFILSS